MNLIFGKVMNSFKDDIQDIGNWITEQETKERLLKDQLKEWQVKLEDKEIYLENLRNARWVITEVVKRTQLQFKGYVESLVTKCISTIFDRDFEFVLNYEIKANKTYIQPLIKEGDNELQIPKEDMGVSILNMLSFALRVVLWSLERPRSRAMFVLDEPMRDMGKGKELNRAGDVLRELSQRLKFQLIIITHEQALSRIADKVFEIGHNGEYSYLVEGEKIVKKKTLKRKRKRKEFKNVSKT